MLNSQERKQARIERDKQRRAQRKAERNQNSDNYDKVITTQHFHQALRKCRIGVMWKGKPQGYCQKAVTNIIETVDFMSKGALPKLKYTPPMIYIERGKAREITPIQFEDRLIQRVICDKSIVPTIQPMIIYDNGASIKGKGTEFTRKRLELFLRRAHREFGDDFYVFKFDFKSFFDSIPHSTIYKILNEQYEDERIVNMIMQIVRSYKEEAIKRIEDENIRQQELDKLYNNELSGICLGSQVSQDLALLTPNKLDHYIKDKRHMKYYIRYMDDGVIMHKDKELLLDIYKSAIKICNELGLTFNEKKTHIIKISKGFSFLKVRYRIADGKIVKTLSKDGVTRMRRKLKKFRKLVDKGDMTLDDVYNSMQSWLAHAKIASSYKTVKSMMKLYNELFDGYKLTKKYFKHIVKQGGKSFEVLQDNKWAEFHWNSDNNRAMYCPTTPQQVDVLH